jgi:hypothetical protein
MDKSNKRTENTDALCPFHVNAASGHFLPGQFSG